MLLSICRARSRASWAEDDINMLVVARVRRAFMPVC
jgi:hypothetical protein